MPRRGNTVYDLERELRLAQTHLRGAVRHAVLESDPETVQQLRELLEALEAVSGGHLRRRRPPARQVSC